MAEEVGLFISCRTDEFKSCKKALQKALPPSNYSLHFQADRTFGGLRAYFDPSRVKDFLNMRFIHLYPVYRLSTCLIIYVDHQSDRNFRKFIKIKMRNEIGKEVSVSKLKFMGMSSPTTRMYKFELGVPEKYSLPLFQKMGWPVMTLELNGLKLRVRFCCSMCSQDHTTWGCPIETESVGENSVRESGSVEVDLIEEEISEDPILSFIASEIRAGDKNVNVPVPSKVSCTKKQEVPFGPGPSQIESSVIESCGKFGAATKDPILSFNASEIRTGNKNVNVPVPSKVNCTKKQDVPFGPGLSQIESCGRFGVASTEGIKKLAFQPKPCLLDKDSKQVVCEGSKKESGGTSLIEHPNLKMFFNDCFPQPVLKILYETPGPLDGDRMVIFLSHLKTIDFDRRRSTRQIAAFYTKDILQLKSQLIRIKTMCMRISYLVSEEPKFIKWLKEVLQHFN